MHTTNRKVGSWAVRRKDPIGAKFYKPLAQAESLADLAFYLAAVLSIAVLLIDRNAHPVLYGIAQATFAVSVLLLFLSGIATRVYFATRAHSQRFADFVSNAFFVPLIQDTSVGYHDTPMGNSFERIASSVLENTLFTKAIITQMLKLERTRSVIYAALWLWALLYRATDLEILAVAAQVLFSEQILSRWIRMEWLRSRVERLYDDLYALLQSTADHSGPRFQARAVEALIRYETSKAQAGLSLSTRVFNRLNASLSEEWRSVCAQLGLKLASPPAP